ncbi:MAG: hypothetical protein Q9184_006103 [Pyrenodesmia sp. 2 TL-2023]
MQLTVGGSWAENRRNAYEGDATSEADEEAYETDVTPEPEEATSSAKMAELWKRAVGWVAEKDMVADRESTRRLTTIAKMEAHLLELEASKTLTAKQVHALQEWKARRDEAKMAGYNLPLFQKDGPYDAVYYLSFLDDLCFEGELRSWTNISWSDSLGKDLGLTYLEVGDGRNYAHIELSTTLLEGSNKSVIVKVLETMAHEMMHAMERLKTPEESTTRDISKTVVHSVGLTGHGPRFRRAGLKVQRFVSSLLRLPHLDLDVRALGISHKFELDSLISLDPSDIPDLDEWNFRELEGVGEEVDPAAQLIDESRFDIKRQWDLKAAARSAAPATSRDT